VVGLPATKKAPKAPAKKRTRRGKTPKPENLKPPAPGSQLPPPAGGDPSSDPTAGNGSDQPPHQLGIDPQVLVGVVSLPFSLWSRAADDNRLILTDAEANGLAIALGGVADKYLPTGAAVMGPEIALILAAGMIIGPRLALDPQPEKEEKTKKTKPEKNESVQGSDPADAKHPEGWQPPPDNAASRQ